MKRNKIISSLAIMVLTVLTLSWTTFAQTLTSSAQAKLAARQARAAQLEAELLAIMPPPPPPLSKAMKQKIQARTATLAMNPMGGGITPMFSNSQTPVGQNYVLVDLGTFGGDTSIAYGINNAGQVVGVANDANYSSYPFLYSNASMHNLGTLGGSGGEARGINSNGQIVGSSLISGDMIWHAFLYSNGSMQDLGSLAGTNYYNNSFAYGINTSGQITGYSDTTNYYTHAFLYSNNSMQEIGTPSDTISYAYGINDNGEIAGQIWSNGNSVYHSLWYANGYMNDLGTLYSGYGSSAYAINSSSQIVGTSNTNNTQTTHSFVYSDGSLQDIGALGSGSRYAFSEAHGINSSGQIVGFTTIAGGSTHAYLYSGDVMQDLNSLVVPANSQFTLVQANAINDHGQIVGYGVNSAGEKHAFLLNPLPIGWKDAITNQPPQMDYGTFPIKGSGKDSLIVITHGWQPFITSIFPLPDVSSVDTMSNSIQTYLTSHGMNNWQVFGYKWTANAWKFWPSDALNNAKGEGINLGSAIAIQGWNNVHLISFSAGAGVIQEATKQIKTLGNATVQCTFLDPYVGSDNFGVTHYGEGADWSDCYYSFDITGDVTEQLLNHSYNVNVTQLGPKTGITKFRSQTTGQMEVCTRTVKYHEWSRDFYMNTITGNGVNSDYSGFGFPLSQEGGNWSYALANYTPGNTPSRILGTPDPTCINSIQITPPTWTDYIPNFLSLPTIQSSTGSNQKGNGFLNLTPGSPSWVSTIITVTNPLNSISFDAQFSNVNGSEDMLTVYWDTNTIGTVDERIVQPGLIHYSLKFANALANSSHVLGFRLDPFTSAKSSITITNIILNQVGPSQPFSLSATTNIVNGSLVYQLNGEAGFAYGIQASTNLAGTNWTDIAELINTNGTVQFYDQDAANYPMRFYRGTVSQ